MKRCFFSFAFLLFVLSLSARTREEAQQQLAAQDEYFDLSNSENKRITASCIVHAASENDVELVQLYLDAGTPVNLKNKYGLTALIVAAQHHFSPLVNLLLSKGADPNAADNGGRTPLHEALDLPYYFTMSDFTQPYTYDVSTKTIAQYLLNKNANVNAPDNSGVTPLMIAAKSGNAEVIALLVRHGGDASLLDAEGKNAFGYAQGKPAISALMQAKLSASQRAQLIAWKFSRWSGAIALLLMLVAFFLARSARKGRMAKQAVSFAADNKKLPRLLPLKCESCGSGLAIKPGAKNCPVCNAAINVPSDYEATLELREQAARRLYKAERACRKASFLSAGALRAIIWLLAFLLPAITIFGYAGTLGQMMYGFEEGWWIFRMGTKPDIWIFWTLLGSVVAGAGLFYYASFLGKVHRSIPVLPRLGKSAGKAELSSCSNCGGTVSFEAGSMVAACNYCGSETLRTDVMRDNRAIAAKESGAAGNSLSVAMQRLTQLQQQTWGALQRPLWGLVALLAATSLWAIWGFLQFDALLSIGWFAMIPAMLFLAYAFGKSFRMNFWLQALLLCGAMAFFAWAALLAGLVGAAVGIIVLSVLLPVMLIFLKVFSEK